MDVEIEFRFKRPFTTRIADFFTRSITCGEFDPTKRKVVIYLDAHGDDINEIIDTIIHELLHAHICLAEPDLCTEDDEQIIRKLLMYPRTR